MRSCLGIREEKGCEVLEIVEHTRRKGCEVVCVNVKESWMRFVVEVLVSDIREQWQMKGLKAFEVVKNARWKGCQAILKKANVAQICCH